MEETLTAPKLRIYKIQSYGNDFFAGNGHRDGSPVQALMGYLRPDLVTVFFDLNGSLIDVRKDPHPTAPRVFTPSPPANLEDEWVTSELSKRVDELRFVPRTIEVRRFRYEKIRVEDLPRHYEAFLRDPLQEEPDEWERDSTRKLVEQWVREKRFVLHWGKAYWMNADGSVHSS